MLLGIVSTAAITRHNRVLVGRPLLTRFIGQLRGTGIPNMRALNSSRTRRTVLARPWEVTATPPHLHSRLASRPSACLQVATSLRADRRRWAHRTLAVINENARWSREPIVPEDRSTGDTRRTTKQTQPSPNHPPSRAPRAECSNRKPEARSSHPRAGCTGAPSH